MANEYDRIIHENFKGLTLALVNRIMKFENLEIVPLQRKGKYCLMNVKDTLNNHE